MSISTSYSSYSASSLASAEVEATRAGVDEMLSNENTKYTDQVSGWESVESDLETFLDDLSSIQDDNEFAAQKTTLSDSDYFTATSDGSAAIGEYNITVEQLAQTYQSAMTFSSSSQTMPSSGTLSITVNGSSMSLDMSTLKSGATLSDLVSAINKSSSNPGVTASLVTSNGSTMLMITSDKSGASYGATISYSADSSDTSTAATSFESAYEGLTVLTAAQDAEIKLGSTNQVTITSSSNTLKNVIDGLTLSLTKAQSSDADPVTLTVAADADTVSTNLQTLANDFNTTVSELKALYGSSAYLAYNSTVEDIVNGMKETLRDSLPSGTSLADLGLKFNSGGTLSVDTDTLKDSLTDNPTLLSAAFTDTDGVIDKWTDFLKPYTESGGIISKAQTNAQNNLDTVETKQSNWDTKMTQLYEKYLKEFTEMKNTLETLESNESYLSSS